MSEKILKFKKPEPDRCGWCTIPFKKRKASNDPAYCSYPCGANAQPQHVKAVIRRTYADAS